MDSIWQAVADVIRALFTRPENVALMVSVIANVGMAYFITLMRKEDRADRQAMTEALNTMTEAINNMRVVIAAALGSRGVV